MNFDAAGAIIKSLETASAHRGDPGPAIYARLFEQFPQTRALFALDRDGQVRGSMLAHVFETILDFIGERAYAHRFISAEIITHEGYGVPRHDFAAFFAVVRDEIRAACGGAWTEEMETAWKRLLEEIGASIGGA